MTEGKIEKKNFFGMFGDALNDLFIARTQDYDEAKITDILLSEKDKISWDYFFIAYIIFMLFNLILLRYFY